MAVGGLFRYAQRAFFSKPTPDRQLLKLVKKLPVRSVVEVGVDSLDTTATLLTGLVKQAPGEVVRYTALDLFDQRPSAQDPLALVDAHRRLSQLGAKVRLMPGSPAQSIAAQANSLANTDLLLLSAAATDTALAAAWYFVPRMCHPGTLVLRRDPAADDTQAWAPVPLMHVSQLAAPPTRRAA